MNRHLLVERVKATEKEDSAHGILLPKEYKPMQDRYCLVNLVDFASDCNSVGELIRGQNYIVNATMHLIIKLYTNYLYEPVTY
jgi:hypothetical protein